MDNRQGGGAAGGGQDPQGQGHWAQDQAGQQQGPHREVTRLLGERVPLPSNPLEDVMVVIPGPAKKFLARVTLTANQLSIDFQQAFGLSAAKANYLWQQQLPERPNHPVTLTLGPRDISVIAQETNSITLLFSIRPHDSYCSVVVLYYDLNPAELLAFGRALVRWAIPADRLQYYNPKEEIKAYQWLMAKASDRTYDQQEEANITYDTGLHYFFNSNSSATVQDAFVKHIKYELKKALIIVAHRLLSRLDWEMQEAQTPVDRQTPQVYPLQPNDFPDLAQDFDQFRGWVRIYDNFFRVHFVYNWDDPAVDNAQSGRHVPTQVFLNVDKHGVHELVGQLAATRVHFGQDPQAFVPAQPMRLFRSTFNRWSAVEQIEFQATQLVITHRDLATQHPIGTEHLLPYSKIGYFRYSVVGQSVSSLSIYPMAAWGYVHLESQDANEMVLLQSLLRWRLYTGRYSPFYSKYERQFVPANLLEQLIATLFPDDQQRWHSPAYGWIGSREVGQTFTDGRGPVRRLADGRAQREWTMKLVDKDFCAFTGRLVNKLAIKLIQVISPELGVNMLGRPGILQCWYTYCQFRYDVIPRITRSTSTLPHIEPDPNTAAANPFRVPFHWRYALFDAPNQF